MESKTRRFIYPVVRLLLLCGCAGLSLPVVAQEEKPAAAATALPAPYDRPRSPMMDILILELISGEPINDQQSREVVNREFGRIWNNKEDPFPHGPNDDKETRTRNYQAWIYLATVKASFVDPPNHRGWPSGYGRLRQEGGPAQILGPLKVLAELPLDKVNRTMVNFSIITPAWITDDQAALDKAVKQLSKDWPGNPFIENKIIRIRRMAESFFPKN